MNTQYEYQKKWRKENNDKVVGYGKQYYQKNKEKIREKYKKNKEKLGEYVKQYYKEHVEEKKKYGKEYRKENKEKIKKTRDKYRIKNRERINEYQRRVQRKRNKKNREKWMPVLREIFGVLECGICEYSKCFAALDFHHKEHEKKEKNIARILILKITDERIKEIKKCEILCSNCHRELHNGY